MKRFVERIIFNKTVAKRLIKPVLRWHSQCYKWAGRYAAILNDGVHPKHYIMKYKEWFLDHIKPGWVVLDVGCDTGMLPALLAKKAAFVYAVEKNKERIAVAQMQCSRPNIEYICADATTHNYDLSRPINCVTMSNVLEHIEHRVDFLKKIVSQIKWADENHKCLLFRVPMIDREWITLYKKELGLDYRLDPAHHTEYTLEQFKEELKQANITVKQADIRFGEIYSVCEVVSA
jgi:SAM-dependent methyltransferase